MLDWDRDFSGMNGILHLNLVVEQPHSQMIPSSSLFFLQIHRSAAAAGKKHSQVQTHNLIAV